MNEFACGDLIAGCPTVFRGLDHAGIIERVSEHALTEHGVTADADFASAVRQSIHPL